MNKKLSNVQDKTLICCDEIDSVETSLRCMKYKSQLKKPEINRLLFDEWPSEIIHNGK